MTFAFNGGPGSATVWLHMGCFGPKRVKMLPNGFMPPPPFELEDAATPYFPAEYTLNHRGLTSENHKNVMRGQYGAGHMVSIENESRDELHRDVDSLFDRVGAK